MRTALNTSKKLAVAITTALLMTACASSIPTPDGAVTARNKLTMLQSNSQLASLAPIEIQNAELAVLAAEHPERDKLLSNHLVILANRKVDTATYWAQSRFFVEEREALSQASDTARLEARTLEAERARRETQAARNDSQIAQNRADLARNETQIAQSQADLARTDTRIAQNQAERARQDATAAQIETAELGRQIALLNARETDRGLVVTLGDVLFETGKSTIVGSNDSNLAKLAVFLNKYNDRTVIIEGHTDNVGSDSSNMTLSQARADSVKNYLVDAGIVNSRLNTMGKGENHPVSVNDTSTGRQQNRRVEVIIANSISTTSTQ